MRHFRETWVTWTMEARTRDGPEWSAMDLETPDLLLPDWGLAFVLPQYSLACPVQCTEQSLPFLTKVSLPWTLSWVSSSL